MTHILKKDIFIFLSLLIIVQYNSAAAQDIQSMWETNCNELKKNHLTSPSLKITFSEKPKFKELKKYWAINWNIIRILLPPDNYKHVSVSKSNLNKSELLLVGDKVRISAYVFPDKPKDDVYRTAILETDKSDTSLEGRALTYAMYGGPVRILSELSILGLMVTPDDLKCNNDNYIEEYSIAIPLILKQTRTGILLSAHKNVGKHQGWIEKQRNNDRLEYILHIISESEKNLIYQVSYSIPVDSLYHGIPFMVGLDSNNSNEHQPEWLNALNLALNSNTVDNWKEYLKIANESGISKKSISQTSKNLKIH